MGRPHIEFIDALRVERVPVTHGPFAGAISINDAALTALIHEGEKNALRFLGMGEPRTGAASLRRFLRRKTFLIKKGSTANPWWFKELLGPVS